MARERQQRGRSSSARALGGSGRRLSTWAIASTASLACWRQAASTGSSVAEHRAVQRAGGCARVPECTFPLPCGRGGPPLMLPQGIEAGRGGGRAHFEARSCCCHIIKPAYQPRSHGYTSTKTLLLLSGLLSRPVHRARQPRRGGVSFPKHTNHHKTHRFRRVSKITKTCLSVAMVVVVRGEETGCTRVVCVRRQGCTHHVCVCEGGGLVDDNSHPTKHTPRDKRGDADT